MLITPVKMAEPAKNWKEESMNVIVGQVTLDRDAVSNNTRTGAFARTSSPVLSP